MSEEMAAAPEAPAPTETPAPAEEPKVMVLVTSRLKEVVKGKGLRSAGTFIDALNEKVVAMIEQAADHAKAEGRATVKPVDLAA